MDSPRAAKTASGTGLRRTAAIIARILQVVLCIVCLACASHWARIWAPFRATSWQVFSILQSVNFAIFISVSGCLMSSFLLFAPKLAPSIADDLPGLVDLALSGIWAVFSMSMGGSLLSWGRCRSSSLCVAWHATVALGFVLWILYSISAVLAALDLRDQLAALREASAPAAAHIPAKRSENGASRAASVASDKVPSAADSQAGSDNNV